MNNKPILTIEDCEKLRKLREQEYYGSEEHKHHLVFLLYMAEMNGYDKTKLIKEWDNFFGR